MTTDLSSIDLSVLDKAGIPISHFATYAGISRITVSLWMSATRRGESRKVRPLYVSRAERVLQQIRKAIADEKLSDARKLKYPAFASVLDEYKTDN